jgi:hypothetical protein
MPSWQAREGARQVEVQDAGAGSRATGGTRLIQSGQAAQTQTTDMFCEVDNTYLDS